MNNYRKFQRRDILKYTGFLSVSVLFLKSSFVSNNFSDKKVLKSHEKTQKLAIFHIPQSSSMAEFKSNITKWVNLDRYDQIKYEYMQAGKIIKSKSRFSNNKAYFFVEFSSDTELANFENDLIINKVFNSKKRKSMQYYVTEHFRMKTQPV